VTKGVRTYPYPSDIGLFAIALNYSFKSILSQRAAIASKKYLLIPGGSWFWTIAGQIFPQRLLNLSTNGHQPLFAPFPPHFEQATLKVDITEPEAGKLTASNSGIKQSEHNGVISIADGRAYINSTKKPVQLFLTEGRDDLLGRSGYPKPSERIFLDKLFPFQP
jgi:hypothetical protein